LQNFDSLFAIKKRLKEIFSYIYKISLKHLLLTTVIIITTFSCKKSDPEPAIKNEEDKDITRIKELYR